MSSCNNSTAPINISQGSIKANCKSKCRYVHKYPKSKCIVHNKGSYLSLDYSNGQNPSASFNTNGVEVSDIRIYVPSLHSFDGSYQAGEIVINHRGTSNPLLVCIPIKKSDEISKSTDLLKTIINYTASSAPNSGESVNVNISNFTLENIVPKTSFYSYEGSLLYEPCSGINNYVVFHPKNGYVALPNSYIDKLKSIISSHQYSIRSGPLLFFNKAGNAGSSSLFGGSGGDGIYIDCKPVGEQGEILFTQNKGSSSSNSEMETISAEEFFKNPFVITVISLIGVYGIYRLSKVAWDKFKESKQE